jgi:hypothetical protein
LAKIVPRAASHTRGRIATGIAVAVAACVLLLALVAGPDASGAKVTVLGATNPTPRPACPGSPCEAIGSVTGFQVTTGSVRHPFRAPFNGKVVAWSIKLSKPRASQMEFFNDFYDSPPQARIGVLKQVDQSRTHQAGGSGPPRYKLLRQSPTVVLSRYLGSSPMFALDQPLTVRKGNILALTIPTWAPAFAVGLGDDNGWRASRQPGKCTRTTDIQQSRPQQKIGGEKRYGCFYRTARLLYTASLVRGG